MALRFSLKKIGSGLAQEHFWASQFSSTFCSPLRLCTLIVRATFCSRVFENLLFQFAFLQMTFFFFFLSCLFDIPAMGTPQAVISEEAADEMEAEQEESKEEPRLRRPMSKRDSNAQSLSAFDGNNTSMQQNNTVNFSLLRAQSIINVNYMMFIWFLTWTRSKISQEKWQPGE